MMSTGVKRLLRSAGSVLAAAFLFLASGPDVQAQNNGQRYWVKIYKGIDKPLCIGETVSLTVAYKLNKGQREIGAPLFFLTASNGTVTPGIAPGGIGSGFVDFDFQATEAGVAKISADAAGNGNDMTTIRVKRECRYTYSLFITLKGSAALDGITYKWNDIIKTKGEFLPFASNLERLPPILPNGTMSTRLEVTELKAPPQDECNIAGTTWSGMEGSGQNKYSGQFIQTGGQEGVRFFMEEVEVKHTPSFAIPCKHGINKRDLPLSFTTKDWIQEDFPSEGGNRQIKIESLEKGVEALNKSPGVKASYIAELVIARAY